MKAIFFLFLSLTIIRCTTDSATDPKTPCHENLVPGEWFCEERINYDFCFPVSYKSVPYLWIRDAPLASLSKGVFDQDGSWAQVDNADFIFLPFPDYIDLPDDNRLVESLVICDDGELIGVFYYGKVNFIDFSEYAGYLYLRSDDANPKYYLSGIGEMSKEGVADIINVVRRIKRHN